MMRICFFIKKYAVVNAILRFILTPTYRILTGIYGSSIPLQTIIGNNPNFPHGLHGIFLSGAAVIGNNCTIFHQVTIGGLWQAGAKNYGAPRIGDNVLIGPGAKIIGNCNIGNNVRIGANCTISFDINDNCTIVQSDQSLKVIENR